MLQTTHGGHRLIVLGLEPTRNSSIDYRIETLGMSSGSWAQTGRDASGRAVAQEWTIQPLK